MAPLSYYYLISTILLELGLYILVNLITLKVYGRMIFGYIYQPGTEEFDRSRKIANKKSLSITILVNILFTANSIFSMMLLVGSDWKSKYILLVAVPVAITVLFIVLIIVQYYQFRPDIRDKSVDKLLNRTKK